MSAAVETREAIGRYQLVTRLATGGMAEVYLAREKARSGLERMVVIKRILPHLAEEPAFVDMFLREARLIGRLSHPNVVQIFELGESEGNYFIAMEYIHGLTTRELQVLARSKGLAVPAEVCVSIVTQACRGLHAAHQLCDLEGNPLGLVHRDVSPHNLMITADGHVKLLDFGIAKAVSEDDDHAHSRMLKGKFGYMSPEQCQRQPLDGRSDLFTLGIVVWELLAGKRLFNQDDETDMLEAIMGAEVPQLEEVSDAPRPLCAVVHTALARDRAERFGTAEEMRLALLSAAVQCGLTVSKDVIAAFVHEVVGTRLTERHGAVQAAMERALASEELQWLLPITASYTAIPEREPEEPITLVDRPSGRHPAAAGTPPFLGKKPRVRSIERYGPRRSLFSRLTSWAKAGLSARRVLVVLGLLVLMAAGLVWATAGRDNGPPADDRGGATPGGGQSEVAAGAAAEGEPLRVGWPPVIDDHLLLKEMDPLERYLEDQLGRPVDFIVTPDYADCADRLQAGQFDVAMLPPLLYVRAKEADPRIELLAIKQFDGANRYDGLLLVRADSPLREVSDLEGARFCLTDANSTSGYFLPRYFLRRQGYDPDAFMGEVVWSGQHLQALRDLVEGRCEVAATYNGALFSADDAGLPVGQFRLLAATGTLPQDAVVAGPALSAEMRRQLRDVLLTFDPETLLGRERVGLTQRVTGFSPAEDHAYDELRTAVHSEEEAGREAP